MKLRTVLLVALVVIVMTLLWFAIQAIRSDDCAHNPPFYLKGTAYDCATREAGPGASGVGRTHSRQQQRRTVELCPSNPRPPPS